jgi:Xaa-Pro dipeptidase
MESIEIIKTRQQKLDEAIKDENLNALVLNPGPSLTYFTGLHFHLSERPIIVIIQPDQYPMIVLPELEAAKANHLSYPVSVFTYSEDPDTWVEAFKSAAQAAKPELREIGVEPRGLRFLELRLLEEAVPHASFYPADDLIASLRMFKDDREVTYMQQAAEIAQTALDTTLPYIKVGRTEKEIAAELSMQLMRHGSNPGLPFFPIVSSGPNSANPHAAPSDRQLTQGDLLVIDYGANVNGYFSDITRTFAIGEVDPECQKIADIVMAANIAGRDAVKAGGIWQLLHPSNRSWIRFRSPRRPIYSRR